MDRPAKKACNKMLTCKKSEKDVRRHVIFFNSHCMDIKLLVILINADKYGNSITYHGLHT